MATRKRIVRKYKPTDDPNPRPYLHIRCGTDILEKLEAGGLPGDKVHWADPLSEGPLRRFSSDEEFRRSRAAYLARRYRLPMTETCRRLLGDELRIDRCVRYGETVLWFEADLFDQMNLVYLLDRLPRVAPKARLSLICIGRHPEVERFVGLGQLSPTQLAALFPGRKPVTRGQVALASAVWAAVRDEDPRLLMPFIRKPGRSLPYLGPALRRYLQEYPWTRDGLSRTERLALGQLERTGPQPVADLFRRVQRRERRPFMGDAMFRAVLGDLAAGPDPLVVFSRRIGPMRRGDLAGSTVELTRTGRRVLRARTDWRRINGVGKWIGGVYLTGSHRIWRWSPALGRITRAGR